MYTIKIPVGMHARHAGLVVKAASELTSQITISKGETSADAKRLMALMRLAVKQGDTITVTVEGEDELNDEAKMKSFFFKNF
jgi:phosphocarrier protein